MRRFFLFFFFGLHLDLELVPEISDGNRTSFAAKTFFFIGFHPDMSKSYFVLIAQFLIGTQTYISTLIFTNWHRVVSRAFRVGFGPGSGLKLTTISGLIRTRDVLFLFGTQNYNQNNLATLLNFSDLT